MATRRLVLATATALLGTALPPAAHAQQVALVGILGSKALVVIDGAAPRTLGAGDSHGSVNVVSVGTDHAVLTLPSGRVTVRLGEAPVSVGSPGRGGVRKVVLRADSRGHFVSDGRINGKAIRYMIDTGASTVAIGRPDADRLGIDYEDAQPVMMGTANGAVRGWAVMLRSVRLGEVELFDVQAVIAPQGMPYVLMGNSALNAFNMSRINDEMVLEKRR